MRLQAGGVEHYDFHCLELCQDAALHCCHEKHANSAIASDAWWQLAQGSSEQHQMIAHEHSTITITNDTSVSAHRLKHFVTYSQKFATS